MSNISKNYIYNIISLVTGILFPIFTFPYVSRVLMPEYLGKVSFSQSITNYFLAIALLGIPAYATRELSRARVSENLDEFPTVFTELLIIGIIGSIFSFLLLSICIINVERLFYVRKIILIYSIQVLFAFLTLDHIFIVLENHKRRTIRTIILRMISIILMFSLVKSPGDYLIYGAVLVVPEIIAKFIDLYSCRKYFSKNIKIRRIKRHLKPLLIIFMYVFSVGIYVNLDSSMLGFMKDSSEVGLYASASKMARICIPIIGALGTVLTPKIIGAIKQKKNLLVYEYMDNFIDFNCFIGFPGVILMGILAKNFIYLFSGKGYEASVITMIIMVPIVFFIPVGTFFGGQILLPNDKEKLVFKVAVSGMLLNIILNYLLIPEYSKNGAAIATVFTEILVCIYRGYEVKKIYKDYRFITFRRLRYLMYAVVSSIGIYPIIKLNIVNDFYNLFLGTGIYTLLYFLQLILFKDEYILQIYRIIKNKIKKYKIIRNKI